jgi:hypothetical protein
MLQLYSIKSVALPSFLLVFMGSIDCLTTVIGVLFYGASEANPVLAGVVTNVPLFTVIKLSATFCIAGTYILANKILNSAQDKTAKGFKVGRTVMKAAYAGLVVFLVVVVVNNLTVLLA